MGLIPMCGPPAIGVGPHWPPSQGLGREGLRNRWHQANVGFNTLDQYSINLYTYNYNALLGIHIYMYIYI